MLESKIEVTKLKPFVLYVAATIVKVPSIYIYVNINILIFLPLFPFQTFCSTSALRKSLTISSEPKKRT